GFGLVLFSGKPSPASASLATASSGCHCGSPARSKSHQTVSARLLGHEGARSPQRQPTTIAPWSGRRVGKPVPPREDIATRLSWLIGHLEHLGRCMLSIEPCPQVYALSVDPTKDHRQGHRPHRASTRAVM